MTTQAFYRKWRPHQWDEVIGQEHIIQTLRNAVTSERVGHAYLFAGPRGTGKTTTARLLAKAMNCLAEDLSQRPCNECDHCKAVNEGRFMDLIEIDAASNTSVEDIRDLRDKINFSPSQGRYKVYIIDEVHMLSTAAFNALLKTLEEPPSHAIFILATTEVHKIPATVLSRCQRHEFRRIPVTEIVSQLRGICTSEHLEAEDEALILIARQATGSMRDAISLLDQLASMGQKITLETAQTILGTATNQVVINLIESLIHEKPADGLNQIHQALDAGTDSRQFARQVVEYLRSLLLIQMGNAEQVETTAEIRVQMSQHARSMTATRLLHTLRVFNEAAVDLRGGWQPSLPLEMAFAAALEGEPQPAPLAAAATPAQTTPAPSTSLPVSQPPAQTFTPVTEMRAEAPDHENIPARHSSSRLPKESQPPISRKSAPARPVEVPAEDPLVKAPASGSPVTFQMIMQSWRKVSTLVRQRSPQTQGLLNSCQPLGLKNGMLILGFSSEITKSKMEKGDHLNLTRRALEHLFGAEIPVGCVITNAKSSGLPAGVEVDNDGMISTALRDMGGEVVDVE